MGVTAAVAYLVGTSGAALHSLLTGNGRLILIVAVIIELVLVAVLVGGACPLGLRH